MNEVLKNILTRRSCRSFIKKKIPSEDLKLIVKAAYYAPSGMNRQTWKFTVIQNKEAISRLAKAIADELEKSKIPFITRRPQYDLYEPDTVIIASNDRENRNGRPDCACALQNMFLAANSLGIGSCWINQLNDACDCEKVRELLNEFKIPSNHVVWGMAALGYPEKEPFIAEKNENVVEWIL